MRARQICDGIAWRLTVLAVGGALVGSCGAPDQADLGSVNLSAPSRDAGVNPLDGGQATNGFSRFGEDDGSQGVLDGAAFDRCVGINETAANTFEPADIIFVIDNSPSMRDEIEWTRAKMNDFSQRIKAGGLDHHIVVVSCLPGNCGGGHGNFSGICIPSPLGIAGGCDEPPPYNDSNPPLYLHVDQRIPSQQGLQTVVNTYSQWKTMMRQTSRKHLVVISDDTSTMSAAQFNSAAIALDPSFADYRFHGIFAYQSKEAACAISQTEPCCRFASPGGEGVPYRELATMTGGVQADLCAQDFSPVFDKFASSVVSSARLNCEWLIPSPPAGQTLNPDLVNVMFADLKETSSFFGRVASSADCSKVEHGWFYDDPSKPRTIGVCPQTCKWIQGKPKAQIDLQFGCATKMAVTR